MSENKKPEKLHGQKVRRSGSARHTEPEPKHKNDMQIDYANLEYKRYDNKIYINRDFNDAPMPPEATVPNYDKYDKDGNYIKDKHVATKKKPAKQSKNISMGQVMRGSSKAIKKSTSK